MQNYMKNETNKIEDNDTFCILPWVHVHAWPNGKVYPCCISDNNHPIGDLTKNTIKEIVNGEEAVEIRQRMLRGEKVESCKNCYNAEQYKGSSWRHSFNKHFENIIDETIKQTNIDGTIEPSLKYVDFRFSNFCNLECRTCGAELSNGIAGTHGRTLPEDKLAEYKEKNIINELNVISFTNTKPTFFNDDLKQYLIETESFYFAGGEPVIQKEHFEILSYIHENKWFDKELRYSTNLSTLKYKSHNLFDYWKDFKSVKIYASIDHFGDKLEFIRQNVKSQKVFENLELLFNSHCEVTINTVVSIYNIYYLYDFYEFLEQKGYLEKLERLDILYAFGELHTPALLPTYAKEDLLVKLETDINSELYQRIFKKFPSLETSLKGLPNYIKDESPSSQTFDDFLKFTQNLDKAYSKNLVESLPWVGKIVKKYINDKTVS